MKMSASGPDRTSNDFGAQSLSAGLSGNIAASGGLGNTRATAVGRPTTDIGRVAGMVSRGTARPGQVQAAQMMPQAANQERGVAALENHYKNQPQNPLATAAGAMGVATPAPPTPLPPPAPASTNLSAPPVIGTNPTGTPNNLTPTVGTINPMAPKKPNTLNALMGSAYTMGVQPMFPAS